MFISFNEATTDLNIFHFNCYFIGNEGEIAFAMVNNKDNKSGRITRQKNKAAVSLSEEKTSVKRKAVDAGLATVNKQCQPSTSKNKKRTNKGPLDPATLSIKVVEGRRIFSHVPVNKNTNHSAEIARVPASTLKDAVAPTGKPVSDIDDELMLDAAPGTVTTELEVEGVRMAVNTEEEREFGQSEEDENDGSNIEQEPGEYTSDVEDDTEQSEPPPTPSADSEVQFNFRQPQIQSEETGHAVFVRKPSSG